jgi:hypothetical protein
MTIRNDTPVASAAGARDCSFLSVPGTLTADTVPERHRSVGAGGSESEPRVKYRRLVGAMDDGMTMIFNFFVYFANYPHLRVDGTFLALWREGEIQCVSDSCAMSYAFAILLCRGARRIQDREFSE